MARTDYNILYDPELSFRDIANQFMSMLQKKAQAEKGEDSSNEGDAPKTEVSVKQEPQSEGDKSERLFYRMIILCLWRYFYAATSLAGLKLRVRLDSSSGAKLRPCQ